MHRSVSAWEGVQAQVCVCMSVRVWSPCVQKHTQSGNMLVYITNAKFMEHWVLETAEIGERLCPMLNGAEWG